MPDVNMKFLRAFLALVEERSSAKAARRLDMPQSRLLSQVAALEKAIGRRLLERRFPPGRTEQGRTQLTEEGSAFLPAAVAAMRAYNRLFEDEPDGADPRERNRIIAHALLEMALAALRHDLSDEDAERIDRLLG